MDHDIILWMTASTHMLLNGPHSTMVVKTYQTAKLTADKELYYEGERGVWGIWQLKWQMWCSVYIKLKGFFFFLNRALYVQFVSTEG